VAMGRAIVRDPSAFLMDEPLSNLDAKLRVQTRTQIAALQKRLEVTTAYVTHDQVEAMTMGDRVAVLDAGALQQCATPRDLFMNPTNVFVAGFIGSPAMNLLPATMAGAGSGATHGSLTVAVSTEQAAGATSEHVTIGIRPEAWRIEPGGTEGLTVDVMVVEELGSESFLYCAEPDQPIGGPQVVARAEGLSSNSVGDRVTLVPRPELVYLFDVGTGLRLGGPNPGTPAPPRSLSAPSTG